MDKDDVSTVAGCVLALILVPVLIVVSVLLNGWVLSLLWAWFIVPVFGLPQLSVLSAIGMAIVTGLLTAHLSRGDSKNEKSKGAIAIEVISTLFAPLFTLLVGYIVHILMI